jgi:hydroxymethylpyrimidine pyrophosphatase-like HAD family hydrolase
MTGPSGPGGAATASHLSRATAELAVPRDIDLVVTDLDGTLWDGKGLIHPRTHRALRVLADALVPVLVATGRGARSAWSVMEANEIALPGVFLDGAVGFEFGSTTAFHTHAFSPAVAAQVLEILDELDVSPCIHVDAPGRDIVLGEHPFTHPDYVRRISSLVREEDPWTAVRTLRVLAFTMLGGEHSMVRDLAAQVTARAPVAAATSTDRTYGGLHLSFRPFGVTKWSGVLAYCIARGLRSDRVLAIGDADNDVELLQEARIALAVADGTEAALAHADHVLAPASEGGWAEIAGLLGLAVD